MSAPPKTTAAANLPDTPDAPDAAYAAALGVEEAAFGAVVPEPTLEEAQASDALLAHFAVARPGPSSFPSIATQILELVRYPDLDLNELSRYIRLDGALAGGVLSLANSAVYRGVRTIETVKDAVARLGVSEVARLAAAISMRSLYSADASAEYQRFAPVFSRLFLHAAVSGRAASELAKKRVVPTPGAEQTFMAGLLHDVGKSIAMRSLATVVLAGKIPAPPEPAVARILHHVHLAVGTEMHKIWRLPPTLADVAAHHHDPEVAAGAERGVLLSVRIASAMDLLRNEPETHLRGPAEVLQAARAARIGPSRVHAIWAELDAAHEWVKNVFPAVAAPAPVR